MQRRDTQFRERYPKKGTLFENIYKKKVRITASIILKRNQKATYYLSSF